MYNIIAYLTDYGCSIYQRPNSRITHSVEKRMKRVGIVGLGDMGSGLAKNLIANGFEVTGLDLAPKRLEVFRELGGKPATSVADVGQNADAVFVMVMNGVQAKAVILGQDGLISHMAKGGAVILTATIKPSEAKEIGAGLEGSGIALIDSPVSGGFPGAQGGTLTMMAAAEPSILDEFKPVMDAVSKTIHRVGDGAGQGQVMKSCLQTLIGSIFGATFEAASLAAKAGVSGQALFDVFSTSGAGCGVANTALENIIDRRFEGTGSGIGTMHKDLTISLDMAEELGVPLFMASTAMQIFHQGKTKYPNGDNWVCTRVMEEIVGAELHR
jgi:putative dehydrogenase